MLLFAYEATGARNAPCEMHRGCLIAGQTLQPGKLACGLVAAALASDRDDRVRRATDNAAPSPSRVYPTTSGKRPLLAASSCSGQDPDTINP